MLGAAGLAMPASLASDASANEIGGWKIGIDPETGDILNLTSPEGKGLEGAPLIGFRHHSFDHADIARHLDSDLTPRPEGAILDHDKPGLEHAATARSATISPRLDGVFAEADAFEIRCRMPRDATAEIGAPSRVSYRFALRDDGLEIGLKLEGKRANRMPEAGVLRVAPQGAGDWELLKTGQWISPDRIVRRGAGALHAAFSARCRMAGDPFQIDLLDSALIAPAGTDLMTFDATPPPWNVGVDVVIYNNKWGTNFPMWWEGDVWSRLVLRTTPPRENP